MFSLFKKKPAAQPDFGFLHTDMHSHILPGIDDGSPDMETSLALIRAMQEMGYQQLIATPHVMTDFYPNTRTIILQKRDAVRKALQAAGISMPLDAAAEYLVDETFEELYKKEPLLTLPGGYVLVEMSFHHPYPNFHKVLFDLQMQGYKPIFAHPERYSYFRDLDELQQIKEYGCLLQMNALSITGYYGKPIREKAQKLLAGNMIDFVGTDLHHARHAETLAKSLTDITGHFSIDQTFTNPKLAPAR
ncbi:MAG: CpsB/CapC family capsule biosynthesis tyrosine phosphatase [Saprospiraceae bacterium]